MSDYEIINAPITGDDRGYRLWSVDSAYLSRKRQIALRYLR